MNDTEEFIKTLRATKWRLTHPAILSQAADMIEAIAGERDRLKAEMAELNLEGQGEKIVTDKIELTFVIDIEEGKVTLANRRSFLSHDKVTVLDALHDLEAYCDALYNEVLEKSTYSGSVNKNLARHRSMREGR